MRQLFVLFSLALGTTSVFAQSLSVEELRQQIDARVNALNPYQELLSDPDPDRSMAAMEIMLASDDPVLMNMAMEFGVLSNSPRVREIALASFLATGPSLTIEFDASVSEDPGLRSTLLRSWRGAEGEDQVIYATWKVGPLNPKTACYEFDDYAGQCYLRITPAGVSISGINVSGQLTNDGSGQLVGTVSISGVVAPVPTRITLMK